MSETHHIIAFSLVVLLLIWVFYSDWRDDAKAIEEANERMFPHCQHCNNLRINRFGHIVNICKGHPELEKKSE